MQKNLEYLNLPKLPQELIPKVYESLKGINRFSIANEQYKLFEATKDLVDFTNSIFYFKHNTAVQIIKNFLPVHTDVYRSKAFNYIIDEGGDNVMTCFYDDDNNLIESFHIEIHRWHRLNVCVRHNVINLTRPRIGITVHSIEEIPSQYRW